jgi:hypothetical protein
MLHDSKQAEGTPACDSLMPATHNEPKESLLTIPAETLCSFTDWRYELREQRITPRDCNQTNILE